MGLQALIFDVDGTLAETADTRRAAFNQTFDEFQCGWHWDRRTYSYLMNMSDDTEMLQGYATLMETRLQHPTLGPEKLHQIGLRKMQVFLAMLASGSASLRPGVGRILSEARRNGIALGAISCRPRIEFEMLVTSTLGFDALTLFDASYFVNNKDRATAYKKVVAELGVLPSKTIAIDDNESGIRAAGICGINCIATPGIYTSSDRFDAANIVVSDLGMPAQPYTIISGNPDPAGYVTIPYLQRLIGDKRVAA